MRVCPHYPQASGLTIPDGSTVFAPDNAAMAKDDLKKRTGLTAADLLKPENKQKLVQVNTPRRHHWCCCCCRWSAHDQLYPCTPTVKHAQGVEQICAGVQAPGWHAQHHPTAPHNHPALLPCALFLHERSCSSTTSWHPHA